MKKKHTLNSDLLGLGKTGMIIGGGSMISSIPALNAPAGIKESFIVGASFMPATTVGVMGSHLINQIKGINKRRR